MGHQLYAVGTKVPISPKRTKWKFRKPTSDDVGAIQNATIQLEKKLDKFDQLGILPKEDVPVGLKTNELKNYGMKINVKLCLLHYIINSLKIIN